MGQRGELFTRRVFAEEGAKTYFFNIKENRYGHVFMNLAESRKRESSGFKRQSLMIYQEDLTMFKENFYKALQDLADSKQVKEILDCEAQSKKRSYHFSPHYHKNATFLLITESRKDRDLGTQNETIRLDLDMVDDFLQAFRSAVRFMENRGKKRVVKIVRPSSKSGSKEKSN